MYICPSPATSDTLSNDDAVLFPSDDSNGVAGFAVTGVIVSHVAHYLSVLALYRLSINVFGHDTQRKRLVCFLAAALHIISPAGAFLTAPYMEAPFSFLNITGLYIYSSSHIDLNSGKRSLSHVKLLLSGCFFAVATTVRSNGILSGIPLVFDALIHSYDIVSRRYFWAAGIRLSFVILCGCIVALGFAVPQYFAYTTFCMDDNISRPWCQSLVPSIYGWVQAHYWYVHERISNIKPYTNSKIGALAFSDIGRFRISHSSYLLHPCY